MLWDEFSAPCPGLKPSPLIRLILPSLGIVGSHTLSLPLELAPKTLQPIFTSLLPTFPPTLIPPPSNVSSLNI